MNITRLDFQVPLRYLIGCLFVNFKLLWEPVRALLASHANSMDTDAFWDVFTPALQLAAEKSGKCCVEL